MKTPLSQKMLTGVLTLIVILATDLVITLLNKHIMAYAHSSNLHLLTLIGMGIILVFFFIMISNIHRISIWTVKTLVNLGRLTFGRTLGLILTVVALSVLIYAGYYKVWFGGNLLTEANQFLSHYIKWL